MSQPAHPPRAESRWPLIVALLTLYALLALLPARYQIAPVWFPYVALAFVVASMIAEMSFRTARWVLVERIVLIIFLCASELFLILGLAYVIRMIVTQGKGTDPLTLLASAIAIWSINVLTFSMLYWLIDDGGPEARAAAAGGADAWPDWLFPQAGAPNAVRRGWQPAYADYLFLSYCTATAFSPTDVLPNTVRAKMFMMLESSISLITIAIIAARAINIF